MKRIISVLFIMLLNYQTYSQGCVAIRSTGGISNMSHTDSSKWQLNINNRYFKSYKHFVGTTEQKQRIELGNNVINHSYATDISILHKINSRWSVLIDLPILSNTRSSLYEHSNVGRYNTQSFGIGDIRLAVYSWIVDPHKMPKGNVQIGLGIKLPTGNYNYQDYFHVTTDSVRLGPVDQSIQLGDGGTGLTFELNSFYNISHTISLYQNFYYLSNPREQNGISTTRGGNASALSIKNGSNVMSVPDQVMLRGGLNATIKKTIYSLGVRYEAIPVTDLIGASGGFRRPGYVISAEPGFIYNTKKVSYYAFAPVALVRSRTQSIPDKITTALTGKYTQGDAAFADYSITIGCSINL